MAKALSAQQIEDILQNNYVGHLASSLNDKPYVVPITYYYDADQNSLIGYTAEGRKIEILRQNPQVCVAVSNIRDLSHWQSVILEGRYEELDGMESVKAIEALVTKLERLINEEGKQHVEHIREMARAKDEGIKIVYRIHIDSKIGRYEDGDAELTI